MGKLDTMQAPAFNGDGPGYEEDFAAWSEEQARRLRTVRVPGLDLENIAEEIESLSRSDKRELANRISVLLTHLLKWRYQPHLAGRSWKSTIGVQRDRIDRLLKESPSLRPSVARVVAEEYPRAVQDAMTETNLLEETFPAGCEWAVEEILSPDYLPVPV